MMEDDFGPDTEADDLQDYHDQLPSVEDYKAGTSYRKKSNSVGNVKEIIKSLSQGSLKDDSMKPSSSHQRRRPDPAGIDSLSLVSNMGEDDHDDGGGEENELDLNAAHDTTEEYQVESTKSMGIRKGYGKILLLIFVVVVLIVIVIVAIVLGTKKNNHKSESSSSSNAKTFKMKNSQRYQETISFLTRTGVTSATAFEDKNSPQYIAAQWMAHGDNANLDIPTDQYDISHHSKTFQERYALAVMYYATGGPNWTYQMNFLTENHVCTWYEDFDVVKDEYEIFDGDFISMGVHGCRRDNNNELVPFSLFLPQNNLIGKLPEEIHVLDHLEVLTLKFNSGLTGTIPEGLSRMENLRLLSLQWCDLTGTLPAWIGNANGLEYLALGNNRFTGTVPTEIAELTNLELLALDDNDMAANIELFHNLPNLKSLYLEDNRISGTISDALMASWKNLRELDLSGNNIGGELPANFFNHNNQVQVIDLHGNNIGGTFPEITGATKIELEFLALQDNKIIGTIPDSIINLDVLKHLDLDNNDFTHVVNDKLGEIQTLEYLFLGGNHDGQKNDFPNFVFQLTNLRELSFKGANLVGQIPEAILLMTNLEFLDLHYNDLTGSLPTQIGRLTNLQHLLLKKNKLSGTIPAEMARLTNLQVLLLDQNDFVGDTEAICSSGDTKLVHFASDCNGGITCQCCDVCCDGEDVTCGAGEWDGGFDPIWEYGYNRYRYSYDMGPHVVNIPNPP